MNKKNNIEDKRSIDITSNKTINVKRIHFIDNVGIINHGAAYECRLCGYVSSTKVEMKKHKKGILISECTKNRIKKWLKQLK